MIRILDRYIAGTFLSALGVFTAAFVALFVTIDLATKLGRFFELELKDLSLPVFILQFYLIRIPLFLTLLLPAVVLFAAMFTVTRLARTNEILPVAAAGISLRRMAAPFIVAGLAAAGLMAAVDEFILPPLGERLTLSEELVNAKSVDWKFLARVDRTKLLALRYDRASQKMTGVMITDYDDRSLPRRIVRANECRWDEARRRFIAHDGEIEWPYEVVRPPDGGKPHVRRETIPPGGFAVEAAFKLESLTRSTSWMSRFPCTPLRGLLEEARANPDIPSFMMKVHTRLAFPLSPVILLLLGLPFVLAAYSKSFLRGLFVCLLISMLYYFMFIGCLELGSRGTLPATAAGWGPTAVFGLLGLASFARMRT